MTESENINTQLLNQAYLQAQSFEEKSKGKLTKHGNPIQIDHNVRHCIQLQLIETSIL